ncbi:centriolin isoform X2 [Rhinichthys klamathensis goyatoka]|uniref:centriolin isoform X2 n=1 Tax=Rhinichthys klamathensis goyatoka TaxID=3034132 RepID=UPI0024B4ED7A|nr:centriolin isoform X2 [Rhinichthys klamathensis goyatoka]
MKRLACKMRKQSPTTGSKCSKSLQSKSVTPNAISRSERDGGPREDLNDDDKSIYKGKGTRYITEDLIRRITKCENLVLVQTLDLSTSTGHDKQFRYIENLDKCERLQVLSLSNNRIEKIEKLEKLCHLRELHLSSNSIQKIEGLEHMTNLQVLNLAFNNIEHLPVWMAKKLRSLQIINLHSNKIFSLHEMAKLKPLKNLTNLTLAENPISSLPHYHLFLIFHLRSLEILDGQPVSPQDREQAHQRFHMEEVERLEQELELRVEETAQLQRERAAALEELERQDTANQNLRHQNQEQQLGHKELRRELDTKSEMLPYHAPLLDSLCQLKQKTVELTQACQKHYELEQELAFHKIDVKFEPLPFYPDPEVEVEKLSIESPYIGKSCRKRNILLGARDQHQPASPDLTETDYPREHDMSRHAQLRAEVRLQQLLTEIEMREQQILRASEELRQLEETVSQRRICDAEKEQFRQELQRRIQRLGELRGEMEAVERQLDTLNADRNQAQNEMDQLQNLLHSLDPSDPRHAHVKAQLSKKTQLLAIMSRKHQELEGRLDDMITRIHMETQEIKELEQQLTDGQIAANEVLKRDLEGIISGLQEYLQGMKEQARRAQSDCRLLQREKDTLQNLLCEKELQCTQLEKDALSAESAQEELQYQQQELEDLRKENEELKQAQGQVSKYEAELETQLQERDTEATQLKEELGRLRRLSQMEHSALQAELQKERQAKENALAQMHMAANRELENTELLQQVNTLQEERDSLKEKVDALHGDLEQVKNELLRPENVAKHLGELSRAIATGQEELSCSFEDLGEPVNKKFIELQQEVHRVVSAAQRDRHEAQRCQDRLAGEMGLLRERLRKYHERYQTQAAERCGEEVELHRLREELEDAHEQQYLMLKRLEETEIDRDRLLAELEEQDKQMKAEESQTQEQLDSLSLELQALRRSFSSADRMAAEQLSAAKDKLHSLHSTIEKIHLERAANAEELQSTKFQAAQAIQDLASAEAEIQVLQKLLTDRVHETDGNLRSVPNSSIQQQELERLNQTLKKQQVQTKRLKDQLAQAKEANNGNLEELLEEIGVLRETLLQQNNFLSSLGDPLPNTGYWYYVPSNQNAPSLGSQGTQDSGLDSVPFHSPERGRRSGHRAHREIRPPLNGGYWVYSPHPHAHGKRDAQMFRDSGRESDMEGTRFTPPSGSAGFTLPDGTAFPPGSFIYSHPVPGLPTGSSTVLCGTPPDGARLVYGPPPSNLTIPLVPSGTLHCNVPGHQDLERDLKKAERRLRDEFADKVHTEEEKHTLQEKTTELQQEIKRLRRKIHTLQRHTSGLESTVLHAEEEQCLLGEVECVEKTLLKRRAELREADRLLLEAKTELKDTRAKTKESVQRYNEASRRAEETERELVEMEKRAQDSATKLVRTKQQLRNLQEEVKELQKRKQDQEHTLKEVEEVLSCQDAKFQEVNRKLDRATDRLETVEKELRETQSLEVKLLQNCRETEDSLTQRKTELDKFSTQVVLQQEELSLLDRKLEQWKQEEEVLRVSVEQHRRGLLGVLRQGEDDALLLHQRIQELRVDVQSLAVQKGELDSQLSERKARLAQCKKDQQQEEETLQSLRSAIKKHTAELRHVLEMVQLETRELEGVKLQHNQKLDQLEKSQETLLEVRVDLQHVQQELQEQRGGLHTLQQKSLDLQQQTDKERSSLQEQCRNLEARRTHAQRCLEAAETRARAAETELLRLQTELDKLQQEQKHAHDLRQEISRDTAAAQQQHEEELSRLKKQLVESQAQLDEIREEVKAAAQQREELVKQQKEQKAGLQEKDEKIRRRQQRLDRLGQQLEELKAEVAMKQTQLEEHEKMVRLQQQQSIDLEQQHRLKQQKLQALDRALALRQDRMEQDTVAEIDLQREHKQCTALQEQVDELEQRVCERDNRLQHAVEETHRLQEALLSDRTSAEGRQEAQRNHSRTNRQRLLGVEEERVRLQRDLLTVEKVAQENHKQARTLQEQLSTISLELLCLKDMLQGQEERVSRLCEIKDSVRSVRSQMKVEIDSGVRELESPSSASSDTDSLKENHPSVTLSLGNPAYNTKDEQWRGEALRERLRQQEDHLKVQLRSRMFSQQEALSQRRLQTEGSIQGLRRHVDKLDQLLGNSSKDSSYLSDLEALPKHTDVRDQKQWSTGTSVLT